MGDPFRLRSSPANCVDNRKCADQAVRGDSGWNPFTARTASPTKSTRTTSCAIRNGGSFWVGAKVFSAPTFSKKTRTQVTAQALTWTLLCSWDLPSRIPEWIQRDLILIRISPEQPDLLRRTVAAGVSSIRDSIGLQFAPVPSTANGRSTARTKQPVLFRGVSHQRHKIRAVSVRTKPNQVSGTTFWTFYAVTKAVSHAGSSQNQIWLLLTESNR